MKIQQYMLLLLDRQIINTEERVEDDQDNLNAWNKKVPNPKGSNVVILKQWREECRGYLRRDKLKLKELVIRRKELAELFDELTTDPIK